MLVSHPYDVHVTGEKNLTEKNIALITEAMRGHTSMRFAVISDTQKCYDETADAVEAINARGDIDFLLHGGDLTDYGATKEFFWQRDILNGLAMPYVAVIGNHDCLATGVEAYRAVFGELNFAFTAGNTRFLCLNTNALEFDSSEPVPDFGFIRREVANARGAGIEKTVVLMHACPGRRGSRTLPELQKRRGNFRETVHDQCLGSALRPASSPATNSRAIPIRRYGPIPTWCRTNSTWPTTSAPGGAALLRSGAADCIRR